MQRVGEENLIENEAVPEGMRRLSRGVQPLEFRLESTAEKGTLHTRELRRCHARLIDPVQDTRHGREHCWFEDLHVLKEAQRIARPVANGATPPDDTHLDHALFGCQKMRAPQAANKDVRRKCGPAARNRWRLEHPWR